MSSPLTPPAPLDPRDLDPDPHRQFAAWFAQAVAAGVHEPEAMALATATSGAVPSVRMVLLRGYGPDGYVWYTNATSRKGRELEQNPHAAIVAHWAPVGRQVRLEGAVSLLDEAASDAYFAARDRGSQLGAWASQQSAPLTDRAELEARLAAVARRFDGVPVDRPPHWGGYVLTPSAFEFWQHGVNRLHDRFRYRRDGAVWQLDRLAP